MFFGFKFERNRQSDFFRWQVIIVKIPRKARKHRKLAQSVAKSGYSKITFIQATVKISNIQQQFCFSVILLLIHIPFSLPLCYFFCCFRQKLGFLLVADSMVFILVYALPVGFIDICVSRWHTPSVKNGLYILVTVEYFFLIQELAPDRIRNLYFSQQFAFGSCGCLFSIVGEPCK